MTWDDQISQVRKQIAELRKALDQNDKVVLSHKQTIQDARSKVEGLLDQPYNAREALYELPLVLEALGDNKLVGTLLFGRDDKVIMHNGTVQRSLGIDPTTSRLPSGVFRDGDSGALIPDEDLPWARCVRGEGASASVHLVMDRADVDEVLYFEVTTIPLRKGDSISGAVALFMDLTDSLRADNYIKKLCVQLEQHLSGIEAARRELQFLSDKLGAPLYDIMLAATEPKATVMRNRKVLIADDIPVNQKLLVMQLQKLGLETETADNGLDAADLCKTNNYALIFMDVDMPVLNGFEATQRIRTMEGDKPSRTPIVALTSYDRPGDKEKCIESGMDDYLPKGTAKARMREIVDRFVFGKSPDTDGGAPSNEPEQTGDEIDINKLKESLGENAQQILSLFFGSTGMLMNCLEFAIEEKDARAVNHFAFSVKGPCSSLGFHVMARFAAELTASAEAGRWVEARDSYNSLARMFKQLQSQSGQGNKSVARV
jgi:CheY-like chemotaxis protein